MFYLNQSQVTLEDSYDNIHGKTKNSLVDGLEQQNESNDSADKWVSYDDYTKGSLTTKELDVLSDTIILHINSVKLLEPFVKKYETQKGNDTLSEKQIDSIGKFLQLLNVFIEKFLNMYIQKHSVKRKVPMIRAVLIVVRDFKIIKIDWIECLFHRPKPIMALQNLVEN